MGAYDELLEFSSADSIAAAAYSENFIDMEVAKSQLGVGGDYWLVVRVNTQGDTTADTYGVELRCSATNDGTDLNGTVRTVAIYGCGNAAIEIAGTDARYATTAHVIRTSLPYECDLRYVQLYYNNTTSNGTAWLFDAWMQSGPPKSDRTQIYLSPVGNP